MAFKYRIAQGCEWIRPLVEHIMSTGSMPADATPIYQGRNIIAVADAGPRRVCIKQYKIPSLINRFAYTLVRPTKASRAFRNAVRLESLGIATAHPYAYIEEFSGLLRRSWFICEHIDNAGDLRYAERRPDFPDLAVKIASLMHRLHDEGVWMKDFSPGNVLTTDKSDDFLLIDINRMEFDVKSESKFNRYFSRIVDTEEAVRIIARAYSPDAEQRAVKAFRDYHRRVNRKRKLKKLFKS